MMSKLMRKHNEKGFTLIEVLVSVAIFSFGILGILNMQMLSTVTNVKSRGMTEGVIIAQNLIETLSTLPYDDLLLVDTDLNGLAGFDIQDKDVNAGNADHTDAELPTQDTRYSLFWNVVDDVPMENIKKIRVVVRWDLKGVTSNFELQMMKTNF